MFYLQGALSHGVNQLGYDHVHTLLTWLLDLGYLPLHDCLKRHVGSKQTRPGEERRGEERSGEERRGEERRGEEKRREERSECRYPKLVLKIWV